MPAVRPDRIGVGPFAAGIFMFVGKAKYCGDAGERGRQCGRQLPVDRIDRLTRGPATISCF